MAAMPRAQALTMPPDLIELSEESGAVATAAEPPATVLSEQQQRAAIAIGRSETMAEPSTLVQSVIVIGLCAAITIAMVIFFKNTARARKLAQDQVVAERTAVMIATFLQSSMPHATPSTSTPAAGQAYHSFDEGSTQWEALAHVENLAKLSNGERVFAWVIDPNGFVYADSKSPMRAIDSNRARPNTNLNDMHTVVGAAATTPDAPHSIGSAIKRVAVHGSGFASFNVPVHHAGDGASFVTLFVTGVRHTDFIVAVRVLSSK